MDRYDQFNFRSLLGAWRRRGGLVLALTLLGGALGLVYSLAQEEQYSASTSLLFRNPGFDESVFGSSSFQTVDPSREAATNVRLVSLEAVADLAADEVEGLDGDDVSEKIEVQQEGQSDVVSITATDADPEFAAELANVFAENYVAFRREADRDKINAARDLVEADLQALPSRDQNGDDGRLLREQLSRLSTLAALQTGNAEIVQVAEIPEDPSSPKTLQNLVVGAFLGFVAGLVGGTLLERLDRRVWSPEDLGDAYGAPVLSTLPDSKTFRSRVHRTGDLLVGEREALRMLRTQLRYFNVDDEVTSVLVTSAGPLEGKSTIAWNLALSSASAGSKTLLIDADFHRVGATGYPGLDHAPGLAELLTGQNSLDESTQEYEADDGHSLDVIVSGNTPPNPAEILSSARMAKLLAESKDTYDLVVVDTPPLLVLADAIPLTRIVDGVVVVGRVGATTAESALRLRNQLEGLDAKLLGVVPNRVKVKGGAYSYGYAYETQTADAPRVK